MRRDHSNKDAENSSHGNNVNTLEEVCCPHSKRRRQTEDEEKFLLTWNYVIFLLKFTAIL